VLGNDLGTKSFKTLIAEAIVSRERCAWCISVTVTHGYGSAVKRKLASGVRGFKSGTRHISVMRRLIEVWIPTIVQSMKEMKWVPFGYAMGREEWLKAERKAYSELVESTTAR